MGIILIEDLFFLKKYIDSQKSPGKKTVKYSQTDRKDGVKYSPG
jgi:hypothetical protein